MTRKTKLSKIIILSASALSLMCSVSCTKNEPDQQTLHFTTKHNIKTTLDTQLEMYRADENPNLFYLNFKYYSRTETGQWSISSSPDGPWKTFPDQHMAPEGLRLMPR